MAFQITSKRAFMSADESVEPNLIGSGRPVFGMRFNAFAAPTRGSAHPPTASPKNFLRGISINTPSDQTRTAAKPASTALQNQRCAGTYLRSRLGLGKGEPSRVPLLRKRGATDQSWQSRP